MKNKANLPKRLFLFLFAGLLLAAFSSNHSLLSSTLSSTGNFAPQTKTPTPSLTPPAPTTVTPTPTSGIIKAGYTACGLTIGGGVECWGNNAHGTLGTGVDGMTMLYSTTPVDVNGLTSGVAAISVGYQHVCALTTGGGFKCWGNNAFGQLGDGTTTDRDTPVSVSGLASGVAAIATGYEHTCALMTGGGIKCWGWNDYGQLGDGTTTDRLTPVDVSGLTSGVVAIATGAEHTCALTASGGVKCWGLNNRGQLGDGTLRTQKRSVNVSGLTSGAIAISAGFDHTCALTTSGGVKCWGDNSFGELGDGTTTYRLIPVNVSGLDNGVAAISAGESYTCVLTINGEAKCWGENLYGELGDGSNATRLTPVDVSGLTSGVASISAAIVGESTCAVMTSGDGKCWGYNGDGELGDGTQNNSYVPVTTIFSTGASTSTPTPTPTATPTITVTPGGCQDYSPNWSGTDRKVMPVWSAKASINMVIPALCGGPYSRSSVWTMIAGGDDIADYAQIGYIRDSVYGSNPVYFAEFSTHLEQYPHFVVGDVASGTHTYMVQYSFSTGKMYMYVGNDDGSYTALGVTSFAVDTAWLPNWSPEWNGEAHSLADDIPGTSMDPVYFSDLRIIDNRDGPWVVPSGLTGGSTYPDRYGFMWDDQDNTFHIWTK